MIAAPPRAETMIETRAAAVYTVLLCFLVMAGTVSVMKYPPQLDILKSIFAKSVETHKIKETPISVSTHTVSEPDVEAEIQAATRSDVQPEMPTMPEPELKPEIGKKEEVLPTIENPAVEAVAQPELVEEAAAEASVSQDVKEKKVVTFDIPEDEDADLEPLSRTTTIEQASPMEGDSDDASPHSHGEATPTTANSEASAQDPNTATPTKKKKTHRGKRGGRKLNKNQQKEEDDVDRIVDAAKQLDPTPTLHPDEVTMNGDDMQDVSNIKRIGKLTIDQDRLLGNGSGGTFVFEGKWNVSHPTLVLLICY